MHKTNSEQLRKSYFQLGNFPFLVEAYTKGDKWNGWSCPFLTRPAIETFSKHPDIEPYYKFNFKKLLVGCREKFDNKDKVECPLWLNTTTGEMLHALGYGWWMWDEHDENHIPYETEMIIRLDGTIVRIESEEE